MSGIQVVKRGFSEEEWEELKTREGQEGEKEKPFGAETELVFY